MSLDVIEDGIIVFPPFGTIYSLVIYMSSLRMMGLIGKWNTLDVEFNYIRLIYSLQSFRANKWITTFVIKVLIDVFIIFGIESREENDNIRLEYVDF